MANVMLLFLSSVDVECISSNCPHEDTLDHHILIILFGGSRLRLYRVQYDVSQAIETKRFKGRKRRRDDQFLIV